MVVSDDNATSRWGAVYCETCKADKKVVRVEMLSDTKKLKTLECGHQLPPQETIVMNEYMNISEGTAWVILKDPVAEVRKAIDDNDYFKTVTYACSVLEYCGQQILIWHTKNIGKPLSIEEVHNWKLHAVIEKLLKYNIITDPDAAKLHCIRGLRNEFVHEDYSIKLSSKMAHKISVHHDDIINYTAKLKAVYDELAAKAEAAAAVAD
jgi:hypothetical protein